MTRVIVNDASCLIDLRKGGLLGVLCTLPCTVVVPLPIRKSELLSFTDADWQTLDNAGMQTHDLPPEEVRSAVALKQDNPSLSANDCFCIVTAHTFTGILLTGDSLLRKIATRDGLTVHGVLWVIDELHAAGTCPDAILVHALRRWQEDASVFLPSPKVIKRIRRLDTTR